MKIGLRKPSLKKRIAARTSTKKFIRHSLGLKAPRGMGWITNPKKAAYNRVYNRTTFSIDSLFTGKKSGGLEAIVIGLVIAVIFGAIYLVWLAVREIVEITIHLIKTFLNSKNKDHSTQNETPFESIEHRDLNVFPFKVDSISLVPNLNCPNCSGPMVKRTARRGKNRGNEFYGCSRFPICKGTRSA